MTAFYVAASLVLAVVLLVIGGFSAGFWAGVNYERMEQDRIKEYWDSDRRMG